MRSRVSLPGRCLFAALPPARVIPGSGHPYIGSERRRAAVSVGEAVQDIVDALGFAAIADGESGQRDHSATNEEAPAYTDHGKGDRIRRATGANRDPAAKLGDDETGRFMLPAPSAPPSRMKLDTRPCQG